MFLLSACDALGNPRQHVTGPTVWNPDGARIVTTSQSFTNPDRIGRLISEGLGHLDHSDPSVGPTQTLTIVTAVPEIRQRRGKHSLLTTFELSNGNQIKRRWSAPAHQREWRGAFALPRPPKDVITAVVP